MVPEKVCSIFGESFFKEIPDDRFYLVINKTHGEMKENKREKLKNDKISAFSKEGSGKIIPKD